MLSFKKRPKSAATMFVFVTASIFAQNLTTSDQAKAAFTSKATVGTVTLDGTFASIEGSLKEEGPVHLVVGSDGTYSISLGKTMGAVGEQRTMADSVMSCSWQDPKGNNHPVDLLDCHTPAWFLPELPTLLSSQPTPEWTLTPQTTGDSVPHLKFNYSAPVETGQTSQAVAIDMELSSITLLPAKASFIVHPDSRSYVDIPVQVIYQDYRQLSGVAIPFRIQKFVNGVLFLDITLTSANVN